MDIKNESRFILERDNNSLNCLSIPGFTQGELELYFKVTLLVNTNFHELNMSFWVRRQKSRVCTDRSNWNLAGRSAWRITRGRSRRLTVFNKIDLRSRDRNAAARALGRLGPGTRVSHSWSARRGAGCQAGRIAGRSARIVAWTCAGVAAITGRITRRGTWVFAVTGRVTRTRAW
jgi:hypothetical protein